MIWSVFCWHCIFLFFRYSKIFQKQELFAYTGWHFWIYRYMLQDVRISFWVDTLEKTIRDKNLCKWNRGFVKVYRYFESWKITTVSRLSFWETIEKILLLHSVSWLIDLLDLCRCAQWRLHHNQLFLFFKVCDSTDIATSTCINNL